MTDFKYSQDFLLDRLAVPRLGNVRLRLHFLRRGSSGDYVISGSANEVNVTSNSSKTIYEVQISDLLGRVVGRYNNIDSPNFNLPVTEFQKGVYIINVLDSEGKTYTTKIQR